MATDLLVTCPYDSTHRIAKSRLQWHLCKCNKNYKGANKVQCPFDATHKIDSLEYEHHVSNCPSSGNAIGYKYSFEPLKQVGTVSIQEACSKESNICDEDWSGGHTTYDPLVATQNKQVVRLMPGLSKAKRKAFRKAERMRIASLDVDREGSSDAVKPLEHEAPLRPPRNAAKVLSVNNTDATTTPKQIDDLVSQFQKISTKGNSKENVGKDKIAKISSHKQHAEKEKNGKKYSSEKSSPAPPSTGSLENSFVKNNTKEENNTMEKKKNSKGKNLSGNKGELSIKNASDEERNNEIQTNFKPSTQSPTFFQQMQRAKKISTGRGFTIAYESMRSKALGLSEKDDSVTNHGSIYGYDEEEEPKLESHKVNSGSKN